MSTSTATRTDERPRQRVLLALIGAVVVVAALAGVTGFLLGRNGPDPEQATVVRLSSDGDSLCVDTQEDSCGQPVIRPDDLARVKPGAELTMTPSGSRRGTAVGWSSW